MRGALVWLVLALAFLSGCEESPPPDAQVGGGGGAGGGAGGGLGGSADAGPVADAGGTPGADGGPAPGECVPFEGLVADLLASRCGGCHGGAAPTLGLALDGPGAYDALVQAPSQGRPGSVLVVPGDVGASYLLAKLGPTPPTGSRMPLGGALAPADLARVTAWVATGAQRDADACGGPAPSDVGSVSVAGPDSVGVGLTGALTATVLDVDDAPLDRTVEWVVADPARLYVDWDGGLVGIGVGETTVTARVEGVESAPFAVRVTAARPPTATFRGDVLPLLRARCGVAGCHVDGVEPGDLRFDRDDDRVWEKLVDEAAEQVAGRRRVMADAPERSYLVEKIAARTPGFGGRMPLGQAPLAAEDAALIIRWIVAGAAF
ncbi:MAG: Ig-like domain-containing protein [Myxococcales bacterium]|nr:Ig-like domain-containing protein [Myxococcales bacterium]